jgi:hypothetical protein
MLDRGVGSRQRRGRRAGGAPVTRRLPARLPHAEPSADLTWRSSRGGLADVLQCSGSAHLSCHGRYRGSVCLRGRVMQASRGPRAAPRLRAAQPAPWARHRRGGTCPLRVSACAMYTTRAASGNGVSRQLHAGTFSPCCIRVSFFPRSLSPSFARTGDEVGPLFASLAMSLFGRKSLV